MSKDTGGPAFPVSYDHQTFEPSSIAEAKRLMSGMTLRDYFAAKAMHAAITSNAREFDDMGDSDVAEYSYALADAMLAARVKP
ncbi:hypothetical protein [Pseudomonas sp. BJa3]|uniref:hypothetical protein n=1 Tax=Pseudomonas sp. BJa3 TaxID=2986525 RepID=UPI002265A1B2|nr:hypothetical protein [Pseudomonas sp. BJa3]MCX5511246.1 hypothetical protein [Pseudomonas sp. BJa3]